MAKIFPSFEVISKAKPAPTQGELYLLKHLVSTLDDNAEVYFNPYFNGQRPDMVVVDKVKGIIIIEVKDWHLTSYYIDEKNNWYVRNNNSKIRPPFQQVFTYKSNMFNMHINGLLERQLVNKGFYKLISCFVYFHNENKQSMKSFYNSNFDHIKNERDKLNDRHKKKTIEQADYDRSMDWLKRKNEQLLRDLNILSVTKDCLEKITFPFLRETNLFPEPIYLELLRYLQPPWHYQNQGKELQYTALQERLAISEQGKRQKIKGIAGSGKTTVLAKRAVNAHKRHHGKVLILTYNLTMRMYIKDKLNEVRDDFSWGEFVIPPQNHRGYL